MCLCLQSLVPQEFSVVMGRTASVNFEIYYQDNSMEVKIINIHRCKKGHSFRNTEHHVGITEKSISHNNDNSNITFEERDCIIAGQLSGLTLSFGCQYKVPMT